MNINLKSYKLLLLFAVCIFSILVYIQISWFVSAIEIQNDLEKKSLENIMPDLALEINGLDHSFFHGKIDSIPKNKLKLITSVIDTFLKNNAFESDVYFAFYQDTINGIYESNTEKYKQELVNSSIKSCITCIVSFSIAKDITQRIDESDETFRDRLYENSTFQYFSPIVKLDLNNSEIVWLALHLEKSFVDVFKKHLPAFLLNIFLLITLLVLFYYVLSSLNKHKEIGQIKDDFFNNMTHEFKTPLSSIRLASKMLRTNPDTEKSKSFLDLIEKESFLLENQIDDLLTLSMLDKNKVQLSFSTLDLHSIIRNVPGRLNSIILNSNANVTLNLKANNHYIIADKLHLSNCICNLIENSLKYSSSYPKIEIITENVDELIVVKIRDIGVGISKKYADNIFDKFVRGQQENQYKGQGFGIGLSYVKSIVNLHHGSIALNSAYTLGCEFIIKFKND